MTTTLAYEPPGAGTWSLDRSHLSDPATPLLQFLMIESIETAYGRVFEEIGVPAETIAMRFVNGYSYTQTRPLIGADKNMKKQPPAWVLKVVARVHPEFRRREKAAARSLARPPWRPVVHGWPDQAAALTKANLDLQAVELSELDESGLAEHVVRLFEHARALGIEHHMLHGSDIAPLGLFVHECRGWGIAPEEAVAAMVGASPETSEPARLLVAIGDRIRSLGAHPTSLDEASALAPEIASEIDDYLLTRGRLLYTGYDIDGRTLIEDPDVMFKAIMHGQPPAPDEHERIVADLRGRVPAAGRERFDELVADARAAMHMRDAQGPLTIEWPLGLLRLALVEAGRRAEANGRVDEAEHVLELEPSELSSFVNGSAGPTAETLANRHAARRELRDASPPVFLGPPPVDPPTDALPRSMRRFASLVQSSLEALGMLADGDEQPGGGLNGAGIGETPYVGTAIVAHDASEAMARLAPGDILVTHATSPAFNLVLSMVGALVTASGGPMSHAAVLARELGFSAVVGASQAMDLIPDGSTIEVDPVAGTVRVR